MENDRLSVGIVGGGIAGLTAAYDLAKHGHQVTLFEAAETLGGLSSGFRDQAWEWSLERFYHHIFASDEVIIKFVEEIGFGEALFFPRPLTAIWSKGGAYPFDSPVTVLKFPQLGLISKFRAGLVILYLRLTRDWKPLEQKTAHEWLPRWMGKEAYEVLWLPLLQGKFVEDYQQVNMAWFWARLYKRTPKLGYFRGGFQAFVNHLAGIVEGQGSLIRRGTPITSIRREAGRLLVEAAGEETPFDRVIFTAPLRQFSQIVPDLPDDYRERLAELKSMGALTLVLALRRQITPDVYWLNLPAGEFPFLALVEHTNYVGPTHYGGNRVVYCGHYLPREHRYFSMTKEELIEEFLPGLKRVQPEFEVDWIRKSWLFREGDAQPVPHLGHSARIPPLETPVEGLYLATMSQVYPWDRGTNYAVEMGQRVARRLTGR